MKKSGSNDVQNFAFKETNSVWHTHMALISAIDNVVVNKEKYVKNPKTDFTRNRKCTLPSLINAVLSMSGGTLQAELYEFCKAKATSFTASAFVQQREKVSKDLFRDIFYSFNDSCKGINTFKSYRLIAVDGSDVNCARNPKSQFHFVNEQFPNGYNQIHLNALYDVLTRTFVDIECQPRNKFDERDALITMLKRNKCNSKKIFIADRGYESYNMFAHFINADNTDFLCRVKHGSGAITEIKKLPMQELDIDIAIEVTTTQTKEDKQRGRRFIQTGSKKGKINSPKTIISRWDFPSPYILRLRVVRILLETGEYETLVTSLSRDEFSISKIKELYHLRWGIETAFRELKYVTGLTNLHSKKDETIMQEIFAMLTMYNYCSRISGSIAVKKRQNSKYAYKVNFAMAVRICKRFYRTIEKDFKGLIDDISTYAEPIRPGRRDKRKMRPKCFVGFTYRVAA